jgi:hypothetical protein
MKTNSIFKSLFFVIATFFFVSCEEEETPTRIAMQGNWQLTEATDGAGNDILSKIAFPVAAIQLTDDNGMLGTQSPMFTYIVYGGSKWIEASSKISAIFDYANLRLSTGEFFVGEGVQDVFTVEAKLQATAAIGGLSDVLAIFGVASSYFQQTIYHKFTNVSVSFPEVGKKDEKNSVMIWEFTDATNALYNYKDAQGNYVAWLGWPVANFSKGKFTFTKKVEGVNDIVRDNL